MDFGLQFDQFVQKPRSTQPVTNLSPHVDGGTGGSNASNSAASPSDKAVLHTSVAIVLVALALLWLLGGLAFRSARL